MSKIITVFGATGNQGGSVVDIFLNDPKLKEWRVRGVTRDVTKDSSKKLAAKGVEVVSADMDDKASLEKAMENATAVFAVTNYWEKLDAALETQQGKNLADAAKAAGVKHYIWSSLIDCNKLTNGKLAKIYHFDSKAKVEEYVRELGIPATFFMAGFYMSNLPGGMFRQQEDGAWALALPVPETTSQVPVFDAAGDTGKWIKAIVLGGDALLGRDVLAATAYLTPGQIVDDFRRTFPEAGRSARYVELTHEAFLGGAKAMGLPDFAAEEMLENMLLLNGEGYYGGASLDDSHAILEDKLTTWAEFIKTAPAFKDLK